MTQARETLRETPGNGNGRFRETSIASLDLRRETCRETSGNGFAGDCVSGALRSREPRHASEWPSCESCRSDEDGTCGYRPSQPWTKTPPADIDTYGCCGYWHGTDGSTLRKRCRAVIAEITKTRPPVD